MKKPELLAPVGSKESLVAAIEAGADAVYLGGYMFGARSFANNFNNEEMIEAINYSHLYGVKVYVTLNTLIFDNEVDYFLEYVDFLHKNNVDAIIMQDIGMIDLVHKTFPNLEIHASTQMHIHNVEGVKFAEEIGVKRCVLARELSHTEIKNIKDNTSMPLEVFVHGALCISYSGQCLFSSMIGGRSGNRGTCAQSCRQYYSFYNNDKKLDEGYLLSAKDLNTIENIGSLIEIGVDSLKIEGRMKRPEYVYQVVSLYRRAIDEYFLTNKITVSETDIKDVKKVFNREFTKGFLFNEKNSDIVNVKRPNHIGIEIGKVIKSNNNSLFIKLDDDLSINDGIRIISDNDEGFIVTNMFINDIKVSNAKKGDTIKIKTPIPFNEGDVVLKTSDYNQLNDINKYINSNYRKVLIDMEVKAILDDKLKLKITDGVNEVEVESDYTICEALKVSVDESVLYNQLSKLGDTIYEINEFDFEMSDNIFIPIVKLNELRREAINILNEKRLYKTDYKKCEYNIIVPDFEVFKNINSYNKEGDFNKSYFDYKSIIKLPRVVKEYNYKEDYYLVSEVGALYKYKEFDTDFSLNVTNIYTIAFLHSIGAKQIMVSLELNDEQIENLVLNYKNKFNKQPNLEVLVYGEEELMINKFDLNKKYNVDGLSYLVDRFNNKYPVISYDNFMIIYNYKKRDKKDVDYFKMGINNIRYSYMKYDK